VKKFATLILSALFAAVVLAATPADAAVAVKRVVSPGGIEAWLVEDHTVPVLSLQFAFRGGAALDPKGKEGLAELVSDTLDEGAGDLDSQTFQGKIQDLGAQLSFSAGADNFQGGIFTLTARREDVTRLLNLALTAPRFDAEAVDRVKSQLLSQLSQSEENPRTIVRENFNRLMFGDHPYARRTIGTVDSVKALTQADLKGFVAQRFTRDHLYVSVVGDIDDASLGKLLDATFGNLPATGTPADIPDAIINGQGQTLVIDKDIPQSTVSFGQVGIGKHDPDIYPGLVMNYILGGGGFSSRLTNEVRDKRGLAYSIGTGLGAYDHAAFLSGSVGTRNDSVAESIALIRTEWAKMRDKGVTAAEVKDAKSYLTGSFLTGIGSSSALAGILLSYKLDDRPIDYMETRNALIDKVTVADVNRVAKQLLNPDALIFVVVGEPKGVTSSTAEAPK
jgi:zinc protease